MNCGKHLDAEAKKRALPHKLQGSAKAFAEAAEQFNEKAQQVSDNNVQEFKQAAEKFVEAGTYFKIVGEVLVELVQIAKLTRLQQKAATFQSHAGQGTAARDGFKAKADAITTINPSDAEDPAKAALDKFKEAIGTFKTNATNFKQFADAMSTPSRTELVYLATVFKDKAAEFASQATMFHEKAQLIIGDKVVSSGIQTKFQAAAAAFGKVDPAEQAKAGASGAANAFYEAIRILVG